MNITLQINTENTDEIKAAIKTLNMLFKEFRKYPSFDDLALVVRTVNCLKAEGIESVDKLLCWTENALIKTPNLGRKSLNEIKESLAKFDLKLMDD